MNAFESHPPADVFPTLDSASFAELAADIREHGLREPIVLHDGKILDGAIGIALALRPTSSRGSKTSTATIRSPYVVSLNLKRRHLNESQRGMVAARTRRCTTASARAANLPVCRRKPRPLA